MIQIVRGGGSFLVTALKASLQANKKTNRVFFASVSVLT